MMYRNMAIEELFVSFENGMKVPARKWSGSPDSDLPEGNLSFWFKKPAVMPLTEVVVSAQRLPVDVQSTMRWTTLAWWLPQEESHHVKYEIEEIGAYREVPIEKVYVQKYQDFKNIDLEIQEYLGISDDEFFDDGYPERIEKFVDWIRNQEVFGFDHKLIQPWLEFATYKGRA